MKRIEPFLTFLDGHLQFLGLFSLITFLGSLIVIPTLVIWLPADYFIRGKEFKNRPTTLHVCLYVGGKIIKNCIGIFFLLAGMIMLFLPGQGLVTIVLGVSLLDFPGKVALQNYCTRMSSIQRSLNWIRQKQGVSPFIFHDQDN